MMTFRAHVHMFDATSVCLSCYGDHGGVGRGWDDDVPCTCSYTSVCLSCYGDHGGVGWGGVGMG